VTVRPIRIPRLALLNVTTRTTVTVRIAAIAVAIIPALTACSGAPLSLPVSANAAAKVPATYYVALGDSLAQGVQPNAKGASVETPHGYPDQIYATLHRSHPSLSLIKLGCPGETTVTMINGGICHYPAGSQLKAADAFLRQHRGQVRLVTIDIGANDPETCSGQPSFSQLAVCAVKGIPAAVTHLATIVKQLKAAAGPGVRLVGMNYYLPALAEWRNGLSGHAVAWTAEKLAATFNALLGRVYKKHGIRVANVFGAFQTSDFDDHGQALPRNVTLLCRWTWECAAPPRGPNQHANQAGYQVIARTFLHAAGLS
jgi:lysophospholipase L1-like esterase